MPAPSAVEVKATTAMDDDGRGSVALMVPAIGVGPYLGFRPGGLSGMTDTHLPSLDCAAFLDVHGDGLADRLVLSSMQLDENRGGRFREDAWQGWPYLSAEDCANRDPGVRVVDADNDGRQDVLNLGATLWHNTVRVLAARGTGALEGLDTGIGAETYWTEGRAVLDINGDGLVDFLVPWAVDPVTGRGGVIINTQIGTGDQLETVTNGLGSQTRVIYAPLARLAEDGQFTPCDGISYPQACAAPRMTVVAGVEYDRGHSSPLYVEEGYGDPRRDVLHGFLGFRKRWQRIPDTGEVTEITYSMTRINGRYPFVGREEESTSYVRLAEYYVPGYGVQTARWSATRTAHVLMRTQILGDASILPFVFSSETKRYEGPTFDPENPDATPLTERTLSTTMLDLYGSPTRLELQRGGGVRDVVEIDYINDETSWLVGLPETIRETSYVMSRSQAREMHIDYDTSGRVLEITREPEDPDYTLVARVALRSPSGLPKRLEVTDGITTHATTIDYDADDALPVRATNPLGHALEATWNRNLGVIDTVTDPNGLQGSFDYDGFGRLRRTNRPDGTWSQVDYTSSPEFPVVVVQSSSDGAESTTSYDRLGRPRQSGAKALDGLYRYVDVAYDDLGRVMNVTRPHHAGGTPYYAARYTYDNLDRPIKVTGHDPNVSTSYMYRYDSQFQRHEEYVFSPTGMVTGHFTYNVQFLVDLYVTYPNGWPVGPNVNTWSFYGPFDVLEAVTHEGGTTFTNTFEYDKIGRLTRLVDGDIGEVVTTYDGFDRVETETDGRGLTTTFAYDALGRVLSATAPGGTDSFVYDSAPGKGIGALASETRGDVVATYSYDDLARLTRRRTTIGGESFDVDLTYDPQGRLASVRYPNPSIPGEPRLEAMNAYSATGALDSVTRSGSAVPLWQALEIDAEGRVTRERREDIDRRTTFDPATGRVTGIATYPWGSSTPTQSTMYGYYSGGMLKDRTMTGSVSGKETFHYDGVLQLIQVVTESAGSALTHTYAYDFSGNLEQTSELPGCTLHYGESGDGPHVLSRVACAGQATSFSYDGAGNQTAGPSRSIGFTSFNKPSTLTLPPPLGGLGGGGGASSAIGGTSLPAGSESNGSVAAAMPLEGGEGCTGMFDCLCGTPTCVDGEWTCTGCNEPPPEPTTYTFQYDAAHRRVRKLGPGVDHLYIDDLYERRTDSLGVAHTFYAYVGDERVALAQQGVVGSPSWSAFGPDMLGSPTLVAGTTSAAQSFDVWGQRRDPLSLNTSLPASTPWPSGSTIGFTGHRHDVELDVIDMGGRVYDPKYKRFLSADPVVQGVRDGFAWNHYRYASNNPAMLVDPTGYLVDGCPCVGCCDPPPEPNPQPTPNPEPEPEPEPGPEPDSEQDPPPPPPGQPGPDGWDAPPWRPGPWQPSPIPELPGREGFPGGGGCHSEVCIPDPTPPPGAENPDGMGVATGPSGAHAWLPAVTGIGPLGAYQQNRLAGIPEAIDLIDAMDDFAKGLANEASAAQQDWNDEVQEEMEDLVTNIQVELLLRGAGKSLRGLGGRVGRLGGALRGASAAGRWSSRMMSPIQGIRNPSNRWGSLGKPSTRALNKRIAKNLEVDNYKITGGGGLKKEEYIPGPGGARKGSTSVDITATKDGDTIRVQTTDSRAGGLPDRREMKAAGRILKKHPEGVFLIPKKPKGRGRKR
jgi:RHS repeat-associated protein